MFRPNLPKILGIVFLSAALQTACDDAGSSKAEATPQAAPEQQADEIESMLQAFEKDVEKAPAPPANAPVEPKAPLENIAKNISTAIVGNLEAGRIFFKNCAICHRKEKGGKKIVGPTLWNIVGREKGTLEGFNFSTAMLNAEGFWTENELDHYLESPEATLKGSRMNFPGIPQAQIRADLIVYLKSLSD